MQKKHNIGESSTSILNACAFTSFDYLVLMGRKCPYCKLRTRFTNSKEVYKKDFGQSIYICDKCKNYVGCHKGTTKAFGRIANKKLRRYKNLAHESFDRLWNRKIKENPDWSKSKCRRQAYLWLSKEMGIPKAICHIGMFNAVQCKVTIQLCKPYL